MTGEDHARSTEQIRTPLPFGILFFATLSRAAIPTSTTTTAGPIFVCSTASGWPVRSVPAGPELLKSENRETDEKHAVEDRNKHSYGYDA